MNFNSTNVKTVVVPTSYFFRPISVENEEIFIKSLMEINWDTILGNYDVNQMLKKFSSYK